MSDTRPTFGILLRLTDDGQEVLAGGRSRQEATTIAKLAVLNRPDAEGALIYPIIDSQGDSYLLGPDGNVTNISKALRREA